MPTVLDSKDTIEDTTELLELQQLSTSTSTISHAHSTGDIAESVSIERLDEVNSVSQIAQTLPPSIPDLSPDIQRIPEDSGPEEIELAPTLPELDELFSPETLSPVEDSDIPATEEETIIIQRFEVIGSTVFSSEELEAVISEFTGRPITFTEILQARSAITKLYVENGYITSGAFFPPQPLQDGVARIEVIEGSLEDIEINGTQRLNDSYIRSRLEVGIEPPINSADILERLQLLQIDPLVESISADLQAGVEPGTNRLVVSVTEADSFNVNYGVDNNRSPSVGSVRHQLQLNQANLLGLGDSLNLGYSLTAGSDDFDFAYTLPINPKDGTLAFAVSHSDSEVIEDPFEPLDISSDTTLYELTLRQPLIKKPTQEFALGLTASHQDSQTFLGFDEIGPFPLSPEADSDGRTSVSAARFFQDWTKQSSNQVIALRSQFNLGLDALGATVNDDAPDSRFFSWQGQAQWARSLGPDALLLLKGSLQLTPDSLLSQEQFGIGGQSTVRGYRQNQILTDNGVLGSVEVRLPVLGNSRNGPLLQVAPFLDIGHGWNSGGNNPDDNTLVGVGTGLLFSTNNLNARLDWGIPLISGDSDRDSLQENGIYFSLDYSFF
ncbi:ShlB/FhaC/HecB family hemolysin secretion/activation protein [Adonisia turfae]|uniref:ShlB/FhaC/HecB family hemolysin secretion/activation protein n=1 Tax=Adonisia turfae TaxID=2950184 RepID=UPI0013D62572|nr:ShlB/FhaC/HecB family hemolysin secretion/activation protein [Adonisia turfae]